MSQTSPHGWTASPELDAVMADIFAVEDMGDFHLFRRFKTIAHLMHYLRGEHNEDDDRLSPARMRLLIYLITHRRLGNEAGVAPSELSRHLCVSRNTVSALLNGLEEQALIERHLNQEDRRQFLIRITPAGVALVETRAPQFARFVSSLFETLTPDERDSLSTLLDKLLASMAQKATEICHSALETPVKSV
jgi:DNA-binding MarR family transcriptional regulator